MSDELKQRWLGGYVRNGKRGPAYIIERWIDGVRYHVSTKCRTERAALKELERFEMDPAAYLAGITSTPPPTPAPEITDALLIEFRDWMVTREDRASDAHAYKTCRLLLDWRDALTGRDLRSVTLGELKDFLGPKKQRLKYAQAIKAFCGWLRREKGMLKHFEDPTADLRVPKPRPPDPTERRVASKEDVQKAFRWLPPETRDVMELRLATGMHISEVQRWASSGKMVRPLNRTVTVRTQAGVEQLPLLAVLFVQHKSKREVQVPLSYPEHVEAAERIRARGKIPVYFTMARHLREACRFAGVPYFQQGLIRHSVITWGIEDGAPLADASSFVGHMDPRTTLAHYARLQLPVAAIPVTRVSKS